MVLIERDPEKINQYVKQHPKGLYIEADASTDDVLEYVGIQKAKALITAISDEIGLARRTGLTSGSTIFCKSGSTKL